MCGIAAALVYASMDNPGSGAMFFHGHSHDQQARRAAPLTAEAATTSVATVMGRRRITAIDVSSRAARI